MSPRASILKKLTAPASVARSLSWSSERSTSASILNMVISRDRMDLVLATYPEFAEAPLALPSLRLESEKVGCEKILKPCVSSELVRLVKEHEVCGFVVNWPVQQQGWCGVPCGNVIRILDRLSENKALFTASRPICLWDPNRHCMDEDEWGRSARYSKTPGYNFYRASPMQYESPHQSAFELWNSFSREHWAEYWEENNEERSAEQESTWQDEGMEMSSSQATVFPWHDSADEESAHLQVCV